MNTIPGDVVNYLFDNFIDFNSLKNFGATSKDSKAMAVRSPKYLVPFLSTFFTRPLPQDEKISKFIHKSMEDAFKAIVAGNVALDRQVTINGNRLSELFCELNKGKSSQPLVCLKLLLQNLEDVTCASDSKNASLLPFVHSVIFSDEPRPEEIEGESDDSSSEESESDLRRQELIKQQHKKFVPMLQSMHALQELIFSDTSIQIRKHALEPCSSIKELQMERAGRLFDSASTKLFFNVFPNIGKIRVSGLGEFAQMPSIAENSLVKELVFFDSPVDSRNFRALLKSIPTVEKIVFHRSLRVEVLFADIIFKKPEPVPSVKELHIFEPAPTQLWDEGREAPLTKEYLSKELSFYFPNLQRIEITPPTLI